MPESQWVRYQFGRYVLETGHDQLLMDGEVVLLQRKAFEILLILIENAGTLVRKEVILSRIWPGRKIDDTNLSQHIYTLRRILEDNPKSPTFILTVSGKGYIFKHPVHRTKLDPVSDPEMVTPTDLTLPPTSSSASLEKLITATVVEERDGGSTSLPPPDPIESKKHLLPPPFRGWANRLWSNLTRTVLLWTGLLLTGFLGYHFLFRHFGSFERREQPPHIRPLSSLPGPESHPRFSPDGKFVTFSNSNDGPGNEHIHIKQVKEGDSIQLTFGPYRDQFPTWSPDGQQIAFLRLSVERKKFRLILIPSLGGSERIIGEFWGGLDWSPDNKYLVVVDNPSPGTPSSLWRVSVDGKERSPLTVPVENEYTYDHHPRFSPDGKSIAFIRDINDMAGDLHLLSLDDLSVRQLTFDKQRITSFAWTEDGKHLLFVSDRSKNQRVWRIALKGGSPTVEETLPNGIRHLDVARTSSQLAFTYHLSDSLIKIASLGERVWEKEKVSPLTTHCVINSSQGDHSARFSEDGSKITYISDQTGGEEIWKAKADGSKPVQLTFFQELGVGSPRWSPDGEWLAFDRRSFKQSDIYVMREDGSGLQQLTFQPLGDTMPTWSPDGEWIYYTSYQQGKSQIWKVKKGGSEPIQVTKNEANESIASDDGKYLYFTGLDKKMYRLDFAKEREELVEGLEEIEIGRYWDLTPKAIYFVSDRDKRIQQEERPPNIYRFDLAKRTIVPITKVEGILPEWLPGLSVTRNERMIAFSYLTTMLGDIQLIENWK